MDMYTRAEHEAFLAQQLRLFPEPIAQTEEEAEEFLADCMAERAQSLDEVRQILDEDGMDAAGLTDEELLDMAEVFALPDGTYLIVEA